MRYDGGQSGYLSKDVSGGTNVTLDVAESRAEVVDLSGTLTGDIDVIWPDTAKVVWVNNGTTGAFAVTVKPSGGTGEAITQGTRCAFAFDGAGAALKWTAEL
jgi:hypothetical protein